MSDDDVSYVSVCYICLGHPQHPSSAIWESCSRRSFELHLRVLTDSLLNPEVFFAFILTKFDVLLWGYCMGPLNSSGFIRK